ncbi:hypothetical protein V0M98_17440 [Pseudomonas silesiensis]|uniref:hypothetical protein n=1 Tax=Pseudomonas silesiensis TaxID=1853130 RepID=UPI0030D10BB8
MAALILKTTTSFPTSVPFLRRDPLDGPGVVGIYDFTDPFTFGGAMPATVGNSYSLKAQQDTVLPAVTVNFGAAEPVTNGALVLKDTQYIRLPEVFRMPSTAKRFAFCLWAAFPKTGWPTGATAFLALGGLGIGTSTTSQYFMQARITSSGVVDQIGGGVDGYYTGFGAADAGEIAELANLVNGQPHQLVLEFDGETIPGTAIVRFYVDGILRKTTQTAGWDGVLNTPTAGNTPRLGYLSPFLSTALQKARYFRAWMLTPTVGGKTIAAMVADDYAANAARFG